MDFIEENTPVILKIKARLADYARHRPPLTRNSRRLHNRQIAMNAPSTIEIETDSQKRHQDTPTNRQELAR